MKPQAPGRRRLALLFLTLTIFAVFAANAETLYVALTDRDFTGVATFNEELNLLDQIEITGPVSTLAAGSAGTFYIGRNNSVVQLTDAGNQVDIVSGSSTTEILDLAFNGNTLEVALIDGNFDGIAHFTPTLELIEQIGVSGDPDAIARSATDIYVGIGNTVFGMDAAGNIVASISGSSTTRLVDMSVFGDLLYVGLSDGSFHGVAIFNLALGLVQQLEVAGPVAGLAGGPANSFYIGTGNQVIRYSNSGDILKTVSGSATTQIVDLDFAADFPPGDPGTEAPEPLTSALVGMGLVLGSVLHQRRRNR